MGSCLGKASMGGVIDPTVTVISVDFSGISFGGVSINTKIRVDNPNMGTLDGINIRYKIRKMSDGTLLSEGDVPREFKIPPMNSTDVILPVTFSFTGMGAAGASVMRRGQTDLLVEGTLTFVAPLADKGVTDIPFRGEATIILSEDLSPP
mmetsp:Transcript_32432/g.58652  ORF Transcript_32432/g.58652 Transcript_32432/m.58652 type:complete len:150 (+) Transcript_32432:76-525(+)